MAAQWEVQPTFTGEGRRMGAGKEDGRQPAKLQWTTHTMYIRSFTPATHTHGYLSALFIVVVVHNGSNGCLGETQQKRQLPV